MSDTTVISFYSRILKRAFRAVPDLYAAEIMFLSKKGDAAADMVAYRYEQLLRQPHPVHSDAEFIAMDVIKHHRVHQHFIDELTDAINALHKSTTEKEAENLINHIEKIIFIASAYHRLGNLPDNTIMTLTVLTREHLPEIAKTMQYPDFLVTGKYASYWQSVPKRYPPSPWFYWDNTGNRAAIATGT